MRRPIVRRIPVALLIFGLIFVGLRSAFAATGDEGRAIIVNIPGHRVGDAGAYNVTLHGDWREVEGLEGMIPEADWKTPWTVLAYKWENQRDVRDAEGRVGDAERLLVQRTLWDLNVFSDSEPWTLVPTTEDYVFRPGAAAPFSSTTQQATDGFADPYQLLDLPLPAPRFGSSTNSTTTAYADIAPDCVVQHPFTGVELRAGSRVGWRGPECNGALGGYYLPRYGSHGSDHLTAAVREVRLGAGSALRIEVDSRLALTFSDGMPVPVRVEVAGSEEGQVAVLDLVHFKAGPTARRTGPVATTDALGPLELADARPWGLEESGVGHPFPPSAAYEVAQGGALHRHLQAHPDDYLVATGFLEKEVYEQTNRTWSFLYTNGTRFTTVEAWEAIAEHLDGLAEPARSLVANRGSLAFDWNEQDTKARQLLWPPPPAARMPAELPTVESVLERRSVYGGTSNGWALSVTCDEPACEEIRTTVVVGLAAVHHRLADPEVLGAEALGRINSLDMDSSYLTMDPNGTAIESSAWTWDTASETPLLGGTKAVPEATVESAPPGWTPTVAQAAGAGLLAAVAGLLYFLWPLLKAGPLALFSRVQAPQLADHPARRRILDAIASEPGIHRAELSRRTGLPQGTLRHHLGLLVKGEQVLARPSGGFLCYFASGTVPKPAQAAATKADGARLVLDQVKRAPGLSGLELAGLTGLQPSTVSHHAAKLAAAGLVQPVRDGKAVRFHPTAA